MSPMTRELQRDLTQALGEAQTENHGVAAGIAVELMRSRLEQHFAGFQFSVEGLGEISGDQYIRRLFSPV